MSDATVTAMAASSARESRASTRRSAGPSTIANLVPAISRVTRGCGSRVGAGGTLGAGVDVASAETADDAVGAGDDEGSSLGRATGPHADARSRTAASKRALTARSLATRGRVVRILRAQVPKEIRISWRWPNAPARCEERQAQAPVRAHQAERVGSRTLEQGRSPHRGRDDEQDTSPERRDQGLAKEERQPAHALLARRCAPLAGRH